jgi:phosphotransferase system  glucose/maltose/N-acetylglucosamine-specific IIC component
LNVSSPVSHVTQYGKQQPLRCAALRSFPQVTIVLFGLGLLLGLGALAAAGWNVPAALTCATAGMAALATLFFLLAVALAVALAGGNDVCPNMETIIQSFLPLDTAPLSNYYFFNQGGSLPNVLATAGVVNLTTVEGDVRAWVRD